MVTHRHGHPLEPANKYTPDVDWLEGQNTQAIAICVHGLLDHSEASSASLPGCLVLVTAVVK